jgi:myo-inositol-1(or 4)-monophosphatase
VEVEALAVELAAEIRQAVAPLLGKARSRARTGVAPGGDATLAIDDVAERIVRERLAAEGDVAFYSEDQGFVVYGRPRAVFVIDPIDGTRPAAAGLEASCVSIAVAPPSEDATLGEVQFGVVHEIKTGTCFTAGRGRGARASTASGDDVPLQTSANTDLRALFWTAGLRGRPVVPCSIALETLIDGSSMNGGCFELGSASFAMTRVATGQLDAYVDIGRRLVDDVPETADAFLAIGEGVVLTNFPYDVAASIVVVEEAGGVVTSAAGGSLATHPAVGSGPEHGLAVLASGNETMHAALLDEVTRGITRLRAAYTAGALPVP